MTVCLVSLVIDLYTTARKLMCVPLKVFLVRKIKGNDTGHLYAMKVLKKATLKGYICCSFVLLGQVYSTVQFQIC